MQEMTVSAALGMSLMGILIVFIVLLLLMCVIYIMTAIFKKKNVKEAATATAAVSAPIISNAPPAKGSCGEMSMFNVPDKTAALVMAVVADELDTPLNELRFISIREVEEESR